MPRNDSRIGIQFNLDLVDEELKKGLNSISATLNRLEQSVKGIFQIMTRAGSAIDGLLQRIENSIKDVGAASKGVDFTSMANQFKRVADQIIADARRTNQAVAGVSQSANSRSQSVNGTRGPPSFLGTGIRDVTEVLPTRGPIVQLTGLLFLLQGAFFGLERAIDRIKEVTLGANIALEQQIVSLTTLLGTAERAKTVVADFAIPFAARVPFFEFDQIVATVERLAAEGFGIRQITGNLEAGFNQFTGKFEKQFEGSLVELLGSAAVAFGKTIEQSTDAFISAVQGRFVKLRRFGIDSSALAQFGFSGDRTDQRGLVAALTQVFQTRFGGLLREQSETFKGAISNIQDLLGNIQRTIFTGTFNVVRQTLVRIVDGLSTFEAAFSATVDGSKEKLEALNPVARQLANNLLSTSQFLGKVSQGFIDAAKAASQFSIPLSSLAVAPVLTSLVRFFGFIGSQATQSLLSFVGLYDKFQNKLRLPFTGSFKGFKKSFDAVFGEKQLTEITRFTKQADGSLIGSPEIVTKRIGGLAQAFSNFRSEISKAFSIIGNASQRFTVLSKNFREFFGLSNLVKQMRINIVEFEKRIKAARATSETLKQIGIGLRAGARGTNNLFEVRRLEAFLRGVNILQDVIELLAKRADFTFKVFGKLAGVLNDIAQSAPAKALGRLTSALSAASARAGSFIASFRAGFAALVTGTSTAKAAELFLRIFGQSLSSAISQSNVFGVIGKSFLAFSGRFATVFSVFTSGVLKALQTTMTLAATVVRSGMAVIGGIITSSLAILGGAFKILLIPAIIEAIGAVRDLSKGIDSTRSRVLKEIIDQFKVIAGLIQDIITDIAVGLGFDGFGEEGSRALTSIKGLLDVVIGLVKQLRPAIRSVVPILRTLVNIAGRLVQGVGIILGGLPGLPESFRGLGAELDKVGSKLANLDGSVRSFVSSSDAAAVASDRIKKLGLDIQALEKGGDAFKGLGDALASSLNANRINNFLTFGNAPSPQEIVQRFKETWVNPVQKAAIDASEKLFPSLFGSGRGADDAVRASENVAKVFESSFTRQLKSGGTQQVSFGELFRINQQDAINQLSGKLQPVLRKAKDQVIANASTAAEGRRLAKLFEIDTKDLGKNLREVAFLFTDLKGKIFASEEGSADATKAFVEPIKKATDEARKRVEQFEQQIGQARVDLFSSQAGDNKQAVEQTRRLIDGLTSQGFAENIKATKELVELRSKVDQALQAENAKLADLEGKQAAFLNDTVKRLATQIAATFKGLDISANLERFIRAGGDLGSAAFRDLSRQIRVESEKLGGGTDKAKIAIDRLVSAVRPAASDFADYGATIGAVKNNSSELSSTYRDLSKSISDFQGKAQQSAETQFKSIELQLKLGQITEETAFIRTAALNKLIQQQSILNSNDELAKAGLEAQISTVKNLVKAFDELTQQREALGSFTEADKLRAAVTNFRAIEELLQTFTAEQQVQSGLRTEAIQRTRQLFEALNALTAKQIEQKNAIADSVASLRELGVAQRQISFNQRQAVDQVALGSLKTKESLEIAKKQLETSAKQFDIEQKLIRASIAAAKSDEKVKNIDDAIAATEKLIAQTGKSEANQNRLAELEKQRLEAIQTGSNEIAKTQEEISKIQVDASNQLIDLRNQELDLLKRQQDLQKKMAADRQAAVNSLADFNEEFLKFIQGGNISPGQQSALVEQRIAAGLRRIESLRGVDENERLAAARETLKIINSARSDGLLPPARIKELEDTFFAISRSFQGKDLLKEPRTELQKTRDALAQVRKDVDSVSNTFDTLSAALQKNAEVMFQYVAKFGEAIDLVKAAQAPVTNADAADIFSKVTKAAQSGQGLVGDNTSNDINSLSKTAFSLAKENAQKITDGFSLPLNSFQKTVERVSAGVVEAGNGITSQIVVSAGNVANAATQTAQTIAQSSSTFMQSLDQALPKIGDFSKALGIVADDLKSGALSTPLDRADLSIASATLNSDLVNAISSVVQQDEPETPNTEVVNALNNAINNLGFLVKDTLNQQANREVDINLVLDATELQNVGGTIEKDILNSVLKSLQLRDDTAGDIRN